MPKRRINYYLFALCYAIAFGLLWVEDYLWCHMSLWLRRLIRIPVWRHLAQRLQKLPKIYLLWLFVTPTLLCLPFKVIALYYLGTGHAWLGLPLLVISKMTATALTAALWLVLRVKLLSIPWFARCYQSFIRWRKRIWRYLRSLPVCRDLHRYYRYCRYCRYHILRTRLNKIGGC